MNKENDEMTEWLNQSDVVKQFRVSKIMEAKLTQIHQTLLEKGLEPRKDACAEYYLRQDAIYITLEVDSPERNNSIESDYNSVNEDEYIRTILNLVKVIVDKTSKTWIFQISLIYGSVDEAADASIKSISKHYICNSFRNQWYELEPKPLSR